MFKKQVFVPTSPQPSDAFLKVRSEFNPSKYRKVTNCLYKCCTTNINTFLNASAAPISSVYLFVIEDHRMALKKGNLSSGDKYEQMLQDNILVKYGLTNNLKRRTNEHVKKFGNIYLHTFINIDEIWLKEAENDVRQFFKDNNWHLQTTDPYASSELALIPKEYIDNIVKTYYCKLGEIYKQKSESVLKEKQHLLDKIEHMELLLKERKHVIDTYKFFLNQKV
jgi:hypothetical protein